jgi:hypothetical protein
MEVSGIVLSPSPNIASAKAGPLPIAFAAFPNAQCLSPNAFSALSTATIASA